MIFDSSTSVNFVAINEKNIADLSYVIYTCSIEPFVIFVPTSHGQMQRLIPHADAVELAFFFIYIYKQQML